MKYALIAFVAILPVLAQAASAGAGHEEGIPMAVVYQAINFAIYAILLFVVLRKPVRGFFKGREANFNAALVKAEASRREAEARRNAIQERLQKLESTADETLVQAQAEANALRTRILADAQEMSRNMQEEARRIANAEIERAKLELRADLVNHSVEMSRKMLSEKMAENDQKRLQTEFVDKIQVVR